MSASGPSGPLVCVWFLFYSAVLHVDCLAREERAGCLPFNFI